MSANKEKKNANRAHAVAAWEWFKEAAWLQVLLIVGVVVGLVVAIPFVVQGIVSAINNNESDFYQTHQIYYSDLEKYIAGNDTNNSNGLVGKGERVSSVSDTTEGFVVMFYKDNCDNCDTLQKNVETWYKNASTTYGEGKIKFFTINVGWVPADEAKSTQYEGTKEKYDNKYITLEQQQIVIDNVKDVYLDQDDDHKASAVTEDTLNARLDTGTSCATLPTPLFVNYTKDKESSFFSASDPSKAIFGPIGGLSNSSVEDVAKQMNDIYNFQIYNK